MTIVKVESAKELLMALHTVQHDGDSGGWFFRGQGDAQWRLTPSLWRHPRGKTQQDRETFERDVLHELRRILTHSSMIPDRFLTKDDRDSTEALLALGQHYGAPTRMLDFTQQPLVAAYFAASDCLRDEKATHLAIFAIPGIVENADHLQGSRFTSPADAFNPNMKAQAGLFLSVHLDCEDVWLDSYSQPVVTGAPKITSVLDTRFIKFELPRTEAARLLQILKQRRIDATEIFPGEPGFVRWALDHALLQHAFREEMRRKGLLQ